ncbi:sensor kinase [Trinickia caryophylli]|nr:PAS domain S-box protein [Trinickia caryophylli]WQE15504.1 PAS domain S-box protein [Trinickia caryophylli]GLU33748.1 sensor kinase [Trinickia caryophylli]
MLTAAVVLAITSITAFIVREHLIDAARSSFDARAARVTADLRRELGLCTEVLRGASGLVAAEEASPGTPLSADAWERYVARLALEDAPPCVRTLDYARAPGAPSAAGAGPTSGTPEGVPARLLLTWPRRGDSTADQMLGLRPDTRAALLRAADSGEPALLVRRSQMAEGPESPDAAGRARVDLYLPVYRVAPIPLAPAARRAALAGYVAAQLDTEYLFASVAARTPHIDIRVAAGSPALALYPPGSALLDIRDDSPRFRRTDTLRFGGQVLALAYATDDPALTSPADFGSAAFVAAGCVAALLAGLGAYVFARRHGPRTAAGGERALSSLTEARMMAIIRSSSEAIITIDEVQRIVIFNPMAEQVFRCSAMEAIGETLDRFIPARYREVHRKHVEQFGATGVAERQMGRQRILTGLRADGEEFPIEASISQIADGDGRHFYTVMLRDATERLKAENELKASRQELRKLSANLQNVREEEKTRIARELHDDLGQQLTALKMDLSSVQQLLAGATTVPPAAVAQLQGMRRLIDSTVGSVRRIAADLRPVMLDDLGLLPAIDWLLNDFKTRYGIEVERRIELGDMLLSRNGATTVFRIVQEALTNVVRHAEATRVSVALTAQTDQCTVRVADDGRGATPAQTEGRGEKSFGLLGIRERAHILGGSVSIETAVKRGFTITVILPLAAIQQEEALP